MKILFTFLTITLFSYSTSAKIINLQCTENQTGWLIEHFITLDTDKSSASVELSLIPPKVVNLTSTYNFYSFKVKHYLDTYLFNINRNNLEFDITIISDVDFFPNSYQDGKCVIKKPNKTLI